VVVLRLGRDLRGRREEQLLWTFISRDNDFSARDRGILVGTSVVARHSTESLTTRRRHPYVHAYDEYIVDG